jgi:hypothetical protein
MKSRTISFEIQTEIDHPKPQLVLIVLLLMLVERRPARVVE